MKRQHQQMLTSESLTEGHPDKVCDQISDAVVDHLLSQDPCARVRAECAIAGTILFIAARFATNANIDFAWLARKVIAKIGYTDTEFNTKTCSILSSPNASPPDSKAQFDEFSLTDAQINRITVKNQVTVFGYACDHSPAMMPMPHWLAHRISQRLAEIIRQKGVPYLEPDGRVQVGVEYKDEKPNRIHGITLMVGVRTGKKIQRKSLKDDLLDGVIHPTFENIEFKPDRRTQININPEGVYLAGPLHHSGLTGRKNACDTYGEYARYSGKALSGKDPMRIERSGSYAARHAAKNVVAAGLARECEIMLSYSVGSVYPVSVAVETKGTGSLSDEEISDRVKSQFDFRLAGILRDFRLRRLPGLFPGGFYQHLATFGHFGRQDLDLPWEKTDKTELLLSGEKGMPSS